MQHGIKSNHTETQGEALAWSVRNAGFFASDGSSILLGSHENAPWNAQLISNSWDSETLKLSDSLGLHISLVYSVRSLEVCLSPQPHVICNEGLAVPILMAVPHPSGPLHDNGGGGRLRGGFLVYIENTHSDTYHAT